MSNSLTRVHSNASGLLPQSTSVGLRYGHQILWQRSFSWRYRFSGISQGSGPKIFSPLSSCAGADLPTPAWPSRPNARYPIARVAYLSASLLCFIARNRWCRNFDLLSIAFACTLRLRPDLPYDDQRCVGNLRLSAFWILTRINATHAGILTSQRSTGIHIPASMPWQRSPTIRSRRIRGFGGELQPRYIFGAGSLD